MRPASQRKKGDRKGDSVSCPLIFSADVSWITDEQPDRCREVVLVRGLSDGQFALNPIVTHNHCYHCPPVGRILWRKRVKDGERVGIKAKTHYPARPEKDWDPKTEWPQAMSCFRVFFGQSAAQASKTAMAVK